jgi:hypothetical protein
MKKLSLITTLLIWGLLLTGCSFNVNVNRTDTNEQDNTKPDLSNDVARLLACNDRVGFYLNTNTFNAEWGVEEEAWASFVLNWHVTREEDWNIAKDDVQCFIDMVDQSVNIEFSNHMYNWELQETVIDDEPSVSDAPIAKMRILEWETEEETQARIEETCANMWWTWTDGWCILEDGSAVYF